LRADRTRVAVLIRFVPSTLVVILDLWLWSNGKSKIIAGMMAFLAQLRVVILDLLSLSGDKSKITTESLVPEETGYA
jgi:hypothetical protein